MMPDARFVLYSATFLALAGLACITAAVPPDPTPTARPTATSAASPTGVAPVAPTIAPTSSSPAPKPIGGGSQSLASIPPGATAAVEAARTALASKAGVAATSIQVVRVESVDWPNPALGCPEPGKFYAQVIVPGYRIVLQAGGQSYEYHTNESGSQSVACSGQGSSTKG